MKYLFILFSVILSLNFETAAAQTCSNLFLVKIDFVRDWGVQLLAQDDPTFREPEYIAQIMEAAGIGIVSQYPSDHLYGNKYSDLYDKYSKLMARTADEFLEIMRFTSSGTDANNIFYEFANYAFEKRTGKQTKSANLLFFGRPYGGTHGRVAEISIRYDMAENVLNEFNIPTPHLKTLHPTEQEIADVKIVEKKALAFIRQQVKNQDLKIGGIFLEPISASEDAIKVYRPEFLRQLRALADELNVPIFADEVLTSGGRTGRFWAYQHYLDPAFDFSPNQFVPDVITFGKGLSLSGIAKIYREHEVDGKLVERWKFPYWKISNFSDTNSYPQLALDNTSRANPLVLIQAYQILKKLVNENMSKVAAQTGDYFLQEIRRRVSNVGGNQQLVSGVGMLINVGPYTSQIIKGGYKIKEYKGRWTPPITTSIKDINEILK